MTKRIPVTAAACAVLAALVTGCGSSAISRFDLEHATGFAAYVVKHSDSQGIIVETTRGGQLHAVNIIDQQSQIREFFASTGQPTLIQLGKHAYMRSGYQLALVGKAVTKRNRACYAKVGSYWPRLVPQLVSTQAQLHLASADTVNFRVDIASRSNRGVQTPIEQGQFRFDREDLITYEAIKAIDQHGASAQFTFNFSYPRTAPASLMTTAPTNICKR